MDYLLELENTYKKLDETYNKLIKFEDIRQALAFADQQDWDYLFSQLGDGERGRVWKDSLLKVKEIISNS